MDRNQEIELIERLVDELGEHSYAGSWLCEQIPAIKLAMGSDLEPGLCAISFSEVRRIRDQAQQEAEVIIERARDEARAIREGIRSEVRSALVDVARKVHLTANQITEIWK